jgi:hypothetical protein
MADSGDVVRRVRQSATCRSRLHRRPRTVLERRDRLFGVWIGGGKGKRSSRLTREDLAMMKQPIFSPDMPSSMSDSGTTGLRDRAESASGSGRSRVRRSGFRPPQFGLSGGWQMRVSALLLLPMCCSSTSYRPPGHQARVWLEDSSRSTRQLRSRFARPSLSGPYSESDHEIVGRGLIDYDFSRYVEQREIRYGWR